jgi:hypothetical protein
VVVTLLLLPRLGSAVARVKPTRAGTVQMPYPAGPATTRDGSRADGHDQFASTCASYSSITSCTTRCARSAG